MKAIVKVAAVQMDIHGLEPEVNLFHMCELIDKIMLDERADLIVFPELANSGYVRGLDASFGKDYIRVAEKIPGPFTNGLGEQARKYGVHIVTGMLEAHPTIPASLYNSAVLIGSTGEVIGVHHKMHIPREEKHYFYPGSTADVHVTELGNIGLIVCADGSFPELSRILSLKGAEIICCGYNGSMARPDTDFMLEHMYHQSACRALENMIFYVGCNRVGSDVGGTFYGRSCIAGPMGQILARSETDREESVRAALSEDMLLEARALKGYFYMRQPALYTLISQPF